ncbi:hypothetical protein M3D15_03510 [Pseudoclavibacter alba]|uniref:Uncharacterized protein n=1 Tax=Pseudoclavibacter albus TaxID=272241 RepID=A0ABT2HW92_9MICO|nr:hypothetical protein [Pseudoclavibacter alba]MCT2042405.1 hypothetical protein [Pseudoclavibacter alba]
MDKMQAVVDYCVEWCSEDATVGQVWYDRWDFSAINKPNASDHMIIRYQPTALDEATMYELSEATSTQAPWEVQRWYEDAQRRSEGSPKFVVVHNVTSEHTRTICITDPHPGATPHIWCEAIESQVDPRFPGLAGAFHEEVRDIVFTQSSDGFHIQAVICTDD